MTSIATAISNRPLPEQRRNISEETLAKIEYFRRASFIMLSGCTAFYALMLASGISGQSCG